MADVDLVFRISDYGKLLNWYGSDLNLDGVASIINAGRDGGDAGIN